MLRISILRLQKLIIVFGLLVKWIAVGAPTQLEADKSRSADGHRRMANIKLDQVNSQI